MRMIAGRLAPTVKTLDLAPGFLHCQHRGTELTRQCFSSVNSVLSVVKMLFGFGADVLVGGHFQHHLALGGA